MIPRRTKSHLFYLSESIIHHLFGKNKTRKKIFGEKKQKRHREARPPLREAVKPPRFVPAFGDRLPGDKNSDFFTHLENLKKLRKHHPRLVTMVEGDFTLGSHFHTIKSN